LDFRESKEDLRDFPGCDGIGQLSTIGIPEFFSKERRPRRWEVSLRVLPIGLFTSKRQLV
jgi:hypothetical protein